MLPFCAFLSATPVQHQPSGMAPAPDSGETCWGQIGGSQLTSEHFAVEWETGTVAADSAQETLDHFEAAWAFEVEEQGWRAPVGSEDYLLLVELVAGSGTAYTYGSTCPDGREMAVFRMYVSEPYPAGLAAHELHHAVQAAYGFAHERWFWEATATWVQWHAAPEDAAAVESLVKRGYLSQPRFALTLSDRDNDDHAAHQYAMALFLETLPEGMVQELWEASVGRDEVFGWPIADAFVELGEDLDDHYLPFVEDAATEQLGFDMPSSTSAAAQLPVETKAPDGYWPQTRGQSFFHFDTDAVDPDHGDVSMTIDVNPEGDFRGWLVAWRDGEVELEEIPILEGVGEATLDDLSTTDDGAWLVLTPLGGDDEEWLWLLTAEATGDPPANAPRGASGAGFEEPKGCAVAPGGAWLLGLLLLRRRGRSGRGARTP